MAADRAPGRAFWVSDANVAPAYLDEAAISDLVYVDGDRYRELPHAAKIAVLPAPGGARASFGPANLRSRVDGWVDAGEGNDVVCAGEGNDLVAGGPGRDRLAGGAVGEVGQPGPGLLRSSLTIGGVEVKLENQVCNTISEGAFKIDLGPGEETLSGDKALALARTRSSTCCGPATGSARRPAPSSG